MTSKPQKSAVPSPPKWLSRAEKAAFRSIIEQRNALSRPVSASETEVIVDLITLRSRISDTRTQYDQARARLKQNPSWKADQSHLLAASRMIDAQTAKAHKMAAALGLLPVVEG